jgi:hypothetical protein
MFFYVLYIAYVQPLTTQCMQWLCEKKEGCENNVYGQVKLQLPALVPTTYMVRSLEPPTASMTSEDNWTRARSVNCTRERSRIGGRRRNEREITWRREWLWFDPDPGAGTANASESAPRIHPLSLFLPRSTDDSSVVSCSWHDPTKSVRNS